MFKKAKYIVMIGLALGITSLGMVRSTAHAEVDPKTAACEALGVASTGGTKTCADDPSGPSVNNTLRLGINVLSLIVGFASIVMIIVGGLKYILSQGEGSNTAAAKNTILYAIVGLVVVSLAQVIVRFVLEKATAPPVAKCTAGQVSTVAAPCTP